MRDPSATRDQSPSDPVIHEEPPMAGYSAEAPLEQERIAEADAAIEQGLEVEGRSQLQMVVRRFLHHRLAVGALVIFFAMLLLSTVGAALWHYSYATITNQFATGPSLQHPFGTDTIGHDLFAQVMEGTATSIKTALLVGLFATILGSVIGAVAGYYGKWADSLLMRFTDLVLIFPLIAILLVVANAASKLANNWFPVAVILSLLLWTFMARLVRGTFLSLREKEFVEAQWAIGSSDFRIIFRHMIPNARGPIIVNATLTVGAAMLIESALSFLGLGIQPPQVSLGDLIAAGQDAATTLPWLFVFPAAFLIILILCINFIGDGLRDALDPHQRLRQ